MSTANIINRASRIGSSVRSSGDVERELGQLAELVVELARDVQRLEAEVAKERSKP